MVVPESAIADEFLFVVGELQDKHVLKFDSKCNVEFSLALAASRSICQFLCVEGAQKPRSS